MILFFFKRGIIFLMWGGVELICIIIGNDVLWDKVCVICIGLILLL